MGTSSPQAADSLLQLRKKRTFSLPSFRRAAGGERQQVTKTAGEMAQSAEEAVRVQKAAAWQWYTRGVGEAVVPTKRPPLGNSPPSQAPTDAKSGVDGTSKGGKSIVLQKKPVQPPQAESPRAGSRFKAEASFTRPNSSGAPPTELPDGPSTPLYDEFELSGLRTQMSDFVQRLQHEQSPADVADHQKSKPGPKFPAAASASTDQQQTKAPASVAASDHQLTKLPPSAPPAASTIPFHMRPISALHRLFRKVVSGRSIMKSTNNSLHSSPAAEVLPEPEDDHAQYHYHHYVHHHHHHYHYGQSPEESAATIRSRARRHSESTGIPPRIAGSWEAEADDEEGEGEFEASPISAYLARRRRHSDSFAGHLPPKKAGGDEDEGMKLEETAKAALPLQLQRLYRSERFSPNKIPIMVSADLARPPAAAGSTTMYEFDEERLADMKSRRRHSADYYMEEGSLEGKAEGGGKSGGGTYKLGGAAGGAPLVRRRHSESSRKREAIQTCEVGRRTPSPGRANYWRSPSDRFYADMLERHAILARPRNAALPPLYPQ